MENNCTHRTILTNYGTPNAGICATCQKKLSTDGYKSIREEQILNLKAQELLAEERKRA